MLEFLYNLTQLNLAWYPSTWDCLCKDRISLPWPYIIYNIYIFIGENPLLYDYLMREFLIFNSIITA